MKPDQRVFVGVVAPIDPRIETPEEVRDRVLEAAEYIPVEQLGTTDDCGFSPFCDDTSTTRETAFAKIRARVVGTALARQRSRRPMSDRTRGRGTRCSARSRCRTPRHPARAPAGRAGTAAGEGGAGAEDGGARAVARDDARDAGIHHRRHPGDRRRRQGDRLQRERSWRCGGCPARSWTPERSPTAVSRSSPGSSTDSGQLP